MLLNCPNCGPRNASEFRYGGEVQARPQFKEDNPVQWIHYLYLRNNPLDVLREWWFHQAGCGRWFIAERHTKSHEVHSTYFWSKS